MLIAPPPRLLTNLDYSAVIVIDFFVCWDVESESTLRDHRVLILKLNLHPPSKQTMSVSEQQP